MENSSFIDADFNGTINNVGSWLYQETKGQWIGYDFINLPLNIIPNQVPAHYLNSKTIPHEFGHILGLEHPNRGNLFEMGAPHIMAPRGMYVDSAYQIDPTIDPMAEPNHPGARMNQTLRVVTETNGIDLFSKIKDLAENNQSGCRYVGGIKKTLI